MNRKSASHLRTFRILSAGALGALLTLTASVTRADDPYPPLDDAAQRVVDDAREQMYAIDFQRRADQQSRLAQTDNENSSQSVPVSEPDRESESAEAP